MAQTLGNCDGDEPFPAARTPMHAGKPASVHKNYLISVNVGGRRPFDNGHPVS